jgi:hypothetical protein
MQTRGLRASSPELLCVRGVLWASLQSAPRSCFRGSAPLSHAPCKHDVALTGRCEECDGFNDFVNLLRLAAIKVVEDDDQPPVAEHSVTVLKSLAKPPRRVVCASCCPVLLPLVAASKEAGLTWNPLAPRRRREDAPVLRAPPESTCTLSQQCNTPDANLCICANVCRANVTDSSGNITNT